MEPQETAGDTVEPFHSDVEGPSVLGPEWTQFYTGDGAGGVRTSTEHAAQWVDSLSEKDLVDYAGVEPYVSTAEVAEYFDRTTQWVYWGLKPDPKTGEVRFVWPDGTPIVPERVGGQRRFTMPILRAILQACYRRGTIDAHELKKIVRRIRYTEVGVEWREREGWHYVDVGRGRTKWVPGNLTRWDSRTETWKLKGKGRK